MKCLRARAGKLNGQDTIVGFPKRAATEGSEFLNAYATHEEHTHVRSCTFNLRSDTGCYDGFPIHGNRQLRDDTTSSYSSLSRMFSSVQLQAL